MTDKVKEHIGFHYLLLLLKLKVFHKTVLSKIKDKSVTHNRFRIQPSDSMMWGFCCIAFIELILAEKLC